MLTSLFAGNVENKTALFDMLLTGWRPRVDSTRLGLRLAEANARPAALASAVPEAMELSSLPPTHLQYLPQDFRIPWMVSWGLESIRMTLGREV